MKTLLTFILMTVFSMDTQAKDLVLSLGESHTLNLKSNASVWIQDRDILKAEGQGSRLILRAGREGRTTLKVGADIYQVQVLHPTKTSSLEDLQKFLKGIVGVSAQVSEGDLILFGNLYRMQDWIKIANFAKARNLQFQMRAQISDSLQSEAQKHFRNLTDSAKVPPQTLVFEPMAEMRINASDLAYKKYQTLLSPYGIYLIKDTLSLDIAPTVKVEITVAEIKSGFSQTYGLRWPKQYSAQILDNGSFARGELPFQLDMLESNGHGKILASPNILCRSGKEAEFLAGGEFPIKVLGYRSESIIWKKYGILLRVQPKADSSGRISLSIETEITTLDESKKVDGVPGLLTNRVSSHFDITKPQTIALSGLLKNEEGRSSEGLPLLSRLPILGALFSSKDFQERKSELVIFVRPTILKENETNHELAHLNNESNAL